MKTATQLRLSGSKRGKITRRKAVETPVHIPGEPVRPRGKLTRAARRAWNKLVVDLLVRRVLWQDDGPKLLALIQARADCYRAGGERREAARQLRATIEAEFANRQPSPEPEALTPEPVVMTLETFLAGVQQERASFAQRLVPDQTICRDLEGSYEWPAGDASTIARQYCLDVTQGGLVACELLKRACHRHLDDLETGASRGLFWDPVAARNIRLWFDNFCGLKLEPWEVWICASLLAWKHPSGLRRFREAWVSMGRKNGKTALTAGIGLFGLVADGERFGEIYSAAVKKEQARLIFRDAVRYVTANAELKNHVKRFIGSLMDEKTDSSFQPLSSDVRSLDGLRPSVICADEIHEWPDVGQWTKLVTGTVSRLQPLIVAITTAGAAQVGFAYQKFDVAEKILTGVFQDDRTFVAIYQLDAEDDWRDEGIWIKANPNLGVSVQVEALRKQLKDVEQDPNALNGFLRYQGNRWQTFRQGRSIPIDKWDSCGGMPGVEGSPWELRQKFLAEHSGELCWAGFDLGVKNDLSALAVLFSAPGDAVCIVPWFWMPEEGLLEKERAWDVPLSRWVREGWIKIIDGDMVDPNVIKEDIVQLWREGITTRMESLGFDPWQVPTMMGKLAMERITEVVAVPQKPSFLTAAAKEFRFAVFAGKIWHLQNPVLRWMAGNVVLEEDEKHGGMCPRKINPSATREKVDGIQATITAWNRMMVAHPLSQWDGTIRFLEDIPLPEEKEKKNGS